MHEGCKVFILAESFNSMQAGRLQQRCVLTIGSSAAMYSSVLIGLIKRVESFNANGRSCASRHSSMPPWHLSSHPDSLFRNAMEKWLSNVRLTSRSKSYIALQPYPVHSHRRQITVFQYSGLPAALSADRKHPGRSGMHRYILIENGNDIPSIVNGIKRGPSISSVLTSHALK